MENLSTAVSGIEFINAAGDLVSLSKQNDAEQFYGAVVGLGAFGVITRMTLRRFIANFQNEAGCISKPFYERIEK